MTHLLFLPRKWVSSLVNMIEEKSYFQNISKVTFEEYFVQQTNITTNKVQSNEIIYIR
jgi:hypothetical protein